MKKLTTIFESLIIGLPLIIILTLPGIFIINPLINNSRLNDFSKQIIEYSTRSDIKCIDTQAICGKLNGCGNGMDFFSCTLIKTEIELSKLKNYYKDISLKPAHKTSNHKVIFIIEEVSDYVVDLDYIQNKRMSFNVIKDAKEFKGYYYLIV